MFAAHLKRVYNICNVIVKRELRQTRAGGPIGINPGLDRRLKVFQQEGLPIDDEDAEDIIEQSESDFSKAHEAYDEHINENLLSKHELRRHIVKEKYFKENMPNLLTWSEKEQIRHLCSEHPDEWTPERIAESFPVTPDVVKKLLKYPWKPATGERIARHDASAMRNWKELKEGSLHIPKDMREHFLKFSNRKIPPLNKSSIKIDLTQEKEMGEYESIVKKCAAQTETKQAEQNSTPESITNDKEPSKEIKKKYSKIMTLDELASNLKQRVDSGSNITIPDQMLMDTVNKKPLEINASNDFTELELKISKETKIVQYQEKDDNKKSIMEYPERIRIPKKAYKRGATYKVNDCYYDHDGKFLYRVLGMSN